ncbi:MAG: RdgB/HAM1 family non-canonical purine NTP pyrophosphatase [Acidobacteriia bacterium]|nr:RdgB/HAM1 family non-canonical purine NTP pyrophosphatase [Terriglobia bacterium]
MSRLVVATLNAGKLREFRAALFPAGIEVAGLEALTDRSPVEETGATFEENARIKAEAYSLRTDLEVLADDSGLEVDALHGEPGVRSARYGEADLDDGGRYRLVVERLRGVPPAMRTARFRCALAVARAGRALAVFEGAAEGRILDAPRGENGFGYDPIFFHEGTGRTFAELTRAEKEALSHRGQAIRRMIEAVSEGKLVL